MSAKLAWTDVESSNVWQAAFHEQSKTLCVRFKSGALYSYMNATEEEFIGLTSAISPGDYMNKAIKGSHAYTRWQDEQELADHLDLTG